MQRVRDYTCEDCGELTCRRWRTDRELVCVGCGARRVIRNAVLLRFGALMRRHARTPQQ